MINNNGQLQYYVANRTTVFAKDFHHDKRHHQLK
jgi:hypothetical protein